MTFGLLLVRYWISTTLVWLGNKYGGFEIAVGMSYRRFDSGTTRAFYVFESLTGRLTDGIYTTGELEAMNLR